MLVVGLSAQVDELGERIADAARSNRYRDELLASGIGELPLGRVMDALVEQQAGLVEEGVWARVESVLGERRTAVEALWDAQTARRRRWAAVFAGPDWFWRFALPRHGRGGVLERSDLEFAALHALPARFERGLRYRNEHLRRSAEILHRRAVEGQRRQSTEWLAALRSGKPAAVLEKVKRRRSGVSPYVLSDAVVAEDRSTRAVAAWMLRRMMSLAVPSSVIDALGGDPEAPPRIPSRRIRDELGAQVLIDRLAEGPVDVLETLPKWPPKLSRSVRRRLAAAMVLAATRIPPDERRSDRGPSGLHGDRPGPRFVQAGNLFGWAAALDPEEYLAVLGIGANSPDEETAVRALGGLAQSSWMPPTVARRSPGVILALIDDEDPRVAGAAMKLADRLLAVHADAALRDRVLAIAVAALAKTPEQLAFEPGFRGWCGTGPDPTGPPDGRESQALHTAACHGAESIVEPLIVELEAAFERKATASAQVRHRWLLLDCLGRLAPVMKPEQARRAHDVLSPRFERARGRLSAQESRLIVYALQALFVSVPGGVLPWYDVMLSDDWLRRRLADHLNGIEDVPADRVRRLLDGSDDRYHVLARLGLRIPNVLASEWRAGGKRRRIAVEALSRAGYGKFDRVLALVSKGALPAEFAATVLDAEQRTLQEIAALLPGGDDDANAWSWVFVRAIERAESSSVEADLEALRVLGASPVTDIVLAVVRRAVRSVATGREVAEQALGRQLGVTSPAAMAAVVDTALGSGLPLSGLQPLLRRLRSCTDPRARFITEVADLRQHGHQRLNAVPPPFPAAILRAGIDVEEAVLRSIYRNHDSDHLRPLIDGSVVTSCSALSVVSDDPIWSERLQKAVVRQTMHDDADVRLAAYRALASRNPDLWACAMLVHEGVFDPDPRIRAFAQAR